MPRWHLSSPSHFRSRYKHEINRVQYWFCLHAHFFQVVKVNSSLKSLIRSLSSWNMNLCSVTSFQGNVQGKINGQAYHHHPSSECQHYVWSLEWEMWSIQSGGKADFWNFVNTKENQELNKSKTEYHIMRVGSEEKMAWSENSIQSSGWRVIRASLVSEDGKNWCGLSRYQRTHST